MSERINYIKGDATQPIKDGNKIIVHICNDIGGWGKEFVTAISYKQFPVVSLRQIMKVFITLYCGKAKIY